VVFNLFCLNGGIYAFFISMAKKVRVSLTIPEELHQKWKDAAMFLSGPPLHLTMARLAVEGIEHQIEVLSKQYNKGKVFPEHKGPGKVGRPIET